MAYSSIRVFPLITTATDAGVALDTYIDGELDQLYTNSNGLKDGTFLDARGSYTSLGGRLDAADVLIDAAGTGSNRVLYGTNAERLALATVPNPCVYIETDTYTFWEYTLGGGWKQIYTKAEVDNLIGLMADRQSGVAAARPSSAFTTLVSGTTGVTELVQVYAANTGVVSGTTYGTLSDNSGTSDMVVFGLDSGSGVYSLGAFVIDGTSVGLSVENPSGTALAYWSEVQHDVSGVAKLSGITSTSVFMPVTTSLVTIHTATTVERAVVYAGRLSTSTSTLWVSAYTSTTSGSGTTVSSLLMDPYAPPAVLWTGMMASGDYIKVAAEAASIFNAWGYKQNMEG